MRILLAKAPRESYSYFREGSESLALGYLAAYLRSYGYYVSLVDGQLERLSIHEMIARCVAEQFALVGFTIADPTFISSTYEVAKAVKQALPCAHLTIGGYAPTFHYDAILKECSALNSVVRHEGEETLFELVESIGKGRDWRTIRGIAYRDGDHVVCNEARPLISDLDTLPPPARDYISYIRRDLAEIGVVSVSGSRGCYANCGFCSIRRFYSEPSGATYRLRSVRRVVDEIEQVVLEHDIDEFLLIDDIFTLPGPKGEQRVEEWRRELTRRKLRVMLSIADRADHIRRPLYDLLYDMGVRQIMVGVEATHSSILEYFNKKITLDDVQRAIPVLEALGIDVTITYINFTPRTTLEILRDNLDCLLSLGVNFLLGLLNRLQVYVGTPIAEEMIEQGIVTGSFPDFSYRIPDSRVEVVYEVCRQCFAPLLEISYEIMKIERMFRVKAFRAEKRGEDPRLVHEGKQQFKRTCRTIMEESADLFRGALDYAGNHQQVEDQFVSEMKGHTLAQYDLWHRELMLIRDHSPFFEDRDKILIQ